MSEANQFAVHHTAQLGLDLRHCVFTNVPAQHTASCGQHGLSQSLFTAQCPDLGADDVLRGRHLPVLEVDASGPPPRIASVFGRFAGSRNFSLWNLNAM